MTNGRLCVGVGPAVPELDDARSAAARGDWPAVRAVLAAAPTPTTMDLQIRQLLELTGVEEFLGEVRAAHPDDAWAQTLYASRLTVIGWQIRSAKRASAVSAEQFATFRHYVCRSEMLLMEVVARWPDQDHAWLRRLLNARALEVGQSEADRRYARIHSRDPHRTAAQIHLLQKKLPKWGGSLAAAKEFAVACAAHPSGEAVLADYYFEHWLDLADGEHEAYLASVRGEMVRAFDRLPATAPATPGERFYWYYALSHYAFLLPDAGEHQRTAEAFRRLDGVVLGAWETFYDDPADRYAYYRDDALRRETHDPAD